jgi:hypothetical protein
MRVLPFAAIAVDVLPRGAVGHRHSPAAVVAGCIRATRD